MLFREESDFQRADWPLLQNGAVTLFWRTDILDETIKDIAGLGYEVGEISCGEGDQVFREQMSDHLHWHDQFGYFPWTGNLNALNDGFRFPPFNKAGLKALVLRGFHHIVNQDSEVAHAMLDIIERAARDHLLQGHYLIALIQTDDNKYECPAIGARSANWNRREWLNADRGL